MDSSCCIVVSIYWSLNNRLSHRLRYRILASTRSPPTPLSERSAQHPVAVAGDSVSQCPEWTWVRPWVCDVRPLLVICDRQHDQETGQVLDPLRQHEPPILPRTVPDRQSPSGAEGWHPGTRWVKVIDHHTPALRPLRRNLSIYSASSYFVYNVFLYDWSSLKNNRITELRETVKIRARCRMQMLLQTSHKLFTLLTSNLKYFIWICCWLVCIARKTIECTFDLYMLPLLWI